MQTEVRGVVLKLRVVVAPQAGFSPPRAPTDGAVPVLGAWKPIPAGAEGAKATTMSDVAPAALHSRLCDCPCLCLAAKSMPRRLGPGGFSSRRGSSYSGRRRIPTICGRRGDSPDPHLKHGTVMWEVDGGEGQFAGARGRITSNFFASDMGDPTDNHFGVIFVS